MCLPGCGLSAPFVSTLAPLLACVQPAQKRSTLRLAMAHLQKVEEARAKLAQAEGVMAKLQLVVSRPMRCLTIISTRLLQRCMNLVRSLPLGCSSVHAPWSAAPTPTSERSPVLPGTPAEG